VVFTRDFKDTVRARARRDSAFHRALLREGIECLLAAEVETGIVVLWDYVEASDGSRKSPAHEAEHLDH